MKKEEMEKMTPEQKAHELRQLGDPQLGEEAVSGVTVWLTSVGGYATLNWSAQSMGSNDWVGLYADDSKYGNDYLHYQWAVNGSPYGTWSSYNTGMVARYYSKDARTGEYVLIASGS